MECMNRLPRVQGDSKCEKFIANHTKEECAMCARVKFKLPKNSKPFTISKNSVFVPYKSISDKYGKNNIIDHSYIKQYTCRECSNDETLPESEDAPWSCCNDRDSSQYSCKCYQHSARSGSSGYGSDYFPSFELDAENVNRYNENFSSHIYKENIATEAEADDFCSLRHHNEARPLSAESEDIEVRQLCLDKRNQFVKNVTYNPEYSLNCISHAVRQKTDGNSASHLSNKHVWNGMQRCDDPALASQPTVKPARFSNHAYSPVCPRNKKYVDRFIGSRRKAKKQSRSEKQATAENISRNNEYELIKDINRYNEGFVNNIHPCGYSSILQSNTPPPLPPRPQGTPIHHEKTMVNKDQCWQDENQKYSFMDNDSKRMQATLSCQGRNAYSMVKQTSKHRNKMQTDSYAVYGDGSKHNVTNNNGKTIQQLNIGSLENILLDSDRIENIKLLEHDNQNKVPKLFSLQRNWMSNSIRSRLHLSFANASFHGSKSSKESRMRSLTRFPEKNTNLDENSFKREKADITLCYEI